MCWYVRLDFGLGFFFLGGSHFYAKIDKYRNLELKILFLSSCESGELFLNVFKTYLEKLFTSWGGYMLLITGVGEKIIR